MCRLVAYIGKSIPLENIIVKPKHSLLEQSQVAQEAKLAVNGDGFGIAWYDGAHDGVYDGAHDGAHDGGEGAQLQRPGLYKDVLPAWSDSNLPSICRMVKSDLFMAHVRASTFGTTSRENCHPFAYDNWSFAHNGGIGEFALIRRKVESLLDDAFYNARRGCTDSELFFLLMLTNGLADDAARAVSTTIEQVTQLAQQYDAMSSPIRLTCVFSDGRKIYGFRHASDHKSPSLYLSACLDHGGRAIASEPLHGTGCSQSNAWETVPEDVLIALGKGDVKGQELRTVLAHAA